MDYTLPDVFGVYPSPKGLFKFPDNYTPIEHIIDMKASNKTGSQWFQCN